MSKQPSKITAKVLIIALVFLPVLLVLIAGLFIWFNLTYTGDLSFYDKSKGSIEAVYTGTDGVLLELEDGRLYLSSTVHSFSNHRKFRNVKGLGQNPDLSINQPVLIYEGGVERIIAFSPLEFLIIDEKGGLYRFCDLEITHIVDGVTDAAIMRGAESSFSVWYVDTECTLHKIVGGEDEVVLNEIREIEIAENTVFCLNNSGVLGKIDEGETGATFEPLMENVRSFGAARNSVLPEDGAPLSLNEHFLLSALTDSNELYLYGTLSSSDLYAERGIVTKHDDWTLIASNVEKHSSCHQGVAYITKVGAVSYYGYDLCYMSSEFISREIIGGGALEISLSSDCLTVTLDDGWKLYGQTVHNNDVEDSFLDHPLFWDKKELTPTE